LCTHLILRVSLQAKDATRVTFPLIKHSRNENESAYLRLPLEVRLQVNDLVASCTEMHVGGLNEMNKYGAEIPLSLTCHQMYWEMRSFPTLRVDLHIHNFAALISWLRKREHEQLDAVTKLILHVSIFTLDAVNEQTFRLAPRPPLPDPDPISWPKLPNIEDVCVHVHPYQSRSGTLNPMHSPKQHLWNKRAQDIAESYAGQLRHFHTNNAPRVTGRWVEPHSNEFLDEMKGCYDSGTLYTDHGGVVRCSSLGCDLYKAAGSPRQRWWEI
jgi:hypothetical protein